MPTILIIEDDFIVRQAIADYLSRKKYNVIQAENGSKGLDCFHQQQVDLVLTDLRMPKVDGLEVLATVDREAPETPVIVVSGMGTIEDVIKALKLGAWDYITKPISDMTLLNHAVTRALERVKLSQHNKEYQKHLQQEIKQKTEELHQAQKLEAIGTLAGGIAHDFNNILGAIMGFTDLAMMESENSKKLKEMLDQIKKASLRARDLVAQILTFCRKAENERRPIVIYPIIKEALKLLRATIPTTIEIKSNISTIPERIRADPTEIHQIMMNLCTNSFQAMKNEQGIIEINLKVVQLDEKKARESQSIKPGKYLQLTVRDNGVGIAGSDRESIYDPFFTTKEKGVGTGLGLSVVHGIVKEYNGAIKITSEVGKGTDVKIFFPIISIGGKENQIRPLTFAGGSETILFVDDDPTLVAVTSKMLKSLGYSVKSSNDSMAALELFRDHAADFNLVITDQTMPGLPGSELITEFLKIRPDIKIIICTGYSSIIDEDKAGELGFKGFLSKPFKFERLARTVRRVIDDQPVK